MHLYRIGLQKKWQHCILVKSDHTKSASVQLHRLIKATKISYNNRCMESKIQQIVMQTNLQKSALFSTYHVTHNTLLSAVFMPMPPLCFSVVRLWVCTRTCVMLI